MNKAVVTKAFKKLNSVMPVEYIEFRDGYRGGANEEINGYNVSLVVFYATGNFSVEIYEWDNTPKNYDTLTKMAIEKLKHIANEKSRQATIDSTDIVCAV